MKSKILSVLSALVGLMLVNSGANKFFHYIPVPPDLPEKAVKAGIAFSQIGWVLPLAGAAEVVGGLLLLFKRTRALGVLVVLPVLVGAFLANANTAPSGLPMVIIFIGVIIWITFENREKYLPLIRK